MIPSNWIRLPRPIPWFTIGSYVMLALALAFLTWMFLAGVSAEC